MDSGDNSEQVTSADLNKQTSEDAASEIQKIKDKINKKPSSNVPKDDLTDWEIQDLKDRYSNGEVSLMIDSINPRGGPTTGQTQVTVRAGQLKSFVDAFPFPKCRFGSNSLVVPANYIKCTPTPLSYDETTKQRFVERTDTCIQCEASPSVQEAGIIEFQVSLTGDFSDVATSFPFRYYKPTKVHSIFPRYGPKDGDTVVQVWGENFLDLGEDFRCNFGTSSTKAYFINENYLWCRAAPSNIVQRPMPFSVTLNRQQTSSGKAVYWYYNQAILAKIVPDYGGMQGGTKINLRGSEMLPFDWKQDINNQNDTFCDWGSLGRTPAMVLSSTQAECLSPFNTQKISEVELKLTLNSQNYSSTSVKFSYFNPPQVLVVEPLKGPIEGITEVSIWGTDFNVRRNITCSFGSKVVAAKILSPTHLLCTSPPVKQAGDVPLALRYDNDRFQSDPQIFTYFSSPKLLGGKVSPSCGPTSGFTQLTIQGENFVEIGEGVAKCIFNDTLMTNATVLDSKTLLCDSPPLESVNGGMHYNISVTLDGDFRTDSTAAFYYYHPLQVNAILPPLGPIEGGTQTQVNGSGFKQKNVCDLRVRFGPTPLMPFNISDTSLVVESPEAHTPGQVVVSVSGNNQQFSSDITIHFRDAQNTFEYFQNFFVLQITPQAVANGGNSPIRIRALLLDQFKFDNGTKKEVPFFTRFTDSSGNQISPPEKAERVSDQELLCHSPKTTYTGPVNLQISVNRQQWQDASHPLNFFLGPVVRSVSPSVGVTKNPKNAKMEISGDNFACPAGDCSKLKVRFTNKQGKKIDVDAKMTERGTVMCTIPKYPAPETLDVDVAFNGQDFTHDGVTFGFLDPFVEDVQPRLISTKGSTKLSIKGFGFVQQEESKNQAAFQVGGKSLECNGGLCAKGYSLLSDREVEVGTFEQISMQLGQQNVGFKEFTVSVMDPNGDFSGNNVGLHYYRDPQILNTSSSFAFSNEDKPIVLAADFLWGQGNDLEIMKKYGNFSCKFSSKSDSSRIVFTPALMEAAPIGIQQTAMPNQIRCRTPEWGVADEAVLDVTLNGQDFLGGFSISFLEPLTIDRISPLAGPIGGSTNVHLFGRGYTSKQQQLWVKFGTLNHQPLDLKQVSDFPWSDELYYKDLGLPEAIAHDAELNDPHLENGQGLFKYEGTLSPSVSDLYTLQSPDVQSYGGPVFIQIGQRVSVPIMDESSSVQNAELEVAFPQSSNIEFFFYRKPIVKKVEPTSGLVQGGTKISITGAWFDQQPEYGVHPFCRIGKQVVRAKFIQTTRIICETPEAQPEDLKQPVPIAVSLNGVDFEETGFNFGYYQRPELSDIQPRSGSSQGGTQLILTGQKFSNITENAKNVRCRFRQLQDSEGNANWTDENAPTRFIPAYFDNSTTMRCASPAGWHGGDEVAVDLTFNGVDFTEASYNFHFYSIFGSFPKSAPSDASNQYIQIKGKGFAETQKVTCVLNSADMEPVAVLNSVIKCPMLPENWSPDRTESVPFSVRIDGVLHELGNIHYYKQITIEDVTPLIAPAQGRGSILVSGRNFRDDFENAKLSCRVGNTLQPAQIIDPETVRCVVANSVPLTEISESLLVSVALNSYSWAESDFSFRPYGIHSIHPNSGPISENTNILVSGKGFQNEFAEDARCKFGTDSNYVLVQAQVLDDQTLICKSPSESIDLPESADQEIALPFSIAFGEDLYDPYTQTIHKFHLYRQPQLTELSPLAAQVGKLQEVYVFADSEDGFWQHSDMYGIKCKFGRFGSSPGTYINKTTVLCLTPSIQEDPSEISEETVVLTVAMNGIDFNDDFSSLEFTFVGTGSSLSTGLVILGTLIFGLLIVAFMIFLGGLQDYFGIKNQQYGRSSYVTQNERGNLGPRAYSRASGGGAVGRRSAMPQSRAGGSSRRFAGSRALD